jgi:ABC-type branched-subunit amino acid transport system ATPase component
MEWAAMLSARKLSIAFGGLRALCDVSFEIAGSELTAVSGSPTTASSSSSTASAGSRTAARS